MPCTNPSLATRSQPLQPLSFSIHVKALQVAALSASKYTRLICCHCRNQYFPFYGRYLAVSPH